MAEEEKKAVQKKKFCTNCGKELKAGEVCDCQKEETKKEDATTVNNGVNINTSDIKELALSVWNTILNTFKKPADTIKEEVDNPDKKKSLTIGILLMVLFAIVVMVMFRSIYNGAVDTASSATYGLSTAVTDEISIPYFKIFIYGLLGYIFIAIIPILISFLIAKFSKNNFTFSKAYKLYTISNAPMTLVYACLILALLINVGLLTGLVYIAACVIGMSCFYNFILGFLNEAKFSDNRKGYAATGLVIAWIVVLTIVMLVFIVNTAYTAYTELTSSAYDISDIWY